MKILHYSLGFPPYRTGGMVKFCIDLMKFQKKNGIDVCMLWPGRMHLLYSSVDTIESKDELTDFKSYELINPLPVPLDEGILNVKEFMKNIDKENYIRLLSKIKPDIIHVHTLMGIHKSFFVAAKELRIKIIFTTHDYFGLCPKVTFFYKGNACKENFECQNCEQCNQNALSCKKIYLMQSPLYRGLKNTRFIKKLREIHRNNYFQNNEVKEINRSDDRSKQYVQLRDYYISMIELCDLVHFNSSLTKDIYSKYLYLKNYKIVNITHLDIKDNRIIKKFEKERVNIAYMASTKPFKGFDLLLSALDKVWNSNIHNFQLNVWANTNEKRAYMDVKGNYNIKELNNIFSQTDILIAPSIWYETYGFTVLEAISYGVPVIISNNVGAKDIIGKAGIIIKPNSEEELIEKIKLIISNRNLLYNMNREAFNCRLPKMEDMLELLEELNENIK